MLNHKTHGILSVFKKKKKTCSWIMKAVDDGSNPYEEPENVDFFNIFYTF